jgi:hypothetical protein
LNPVESDDIRRLVEPFGRIVAVEKLKVNHVQNIDV